MPSEGAKLLTLSKSTPFITCGSATGTPHAAVRFPPRSPLPPRGSFLRVQVASDRLAPYDETEIDFLVAYLVPEDLWYVIPVKKLKGLQSLYFYPRGRGKSKWEKYREAWCQMACPHDENGPSKIVTPRCCDKAPVRLPICPLKLLR